MRLHAAAVSHHDDLPSLASGMDMPVRLTRVAEGHLDRQRGQVTHLGERPQLHEPTVAQDRYVIAQGLDLAEDVRREEHRLAGTLGLCDAVLELSFP